MTNKQKKTVRKAAPTVKAEDPVIIIEAPKKTGKLTKEEFKAQLRGKSLDGLNLRLKAPPPRDGFTQRWVNDIGDRIRRFEQRGWTFRDLATVPKEHKIDSIDPGSRIAQSTGGRGLGTAQVTYLMEIPTEYYEAMQELKQEQIDQTEAQLRQGTVRGQSVGQNEYIVNAKIGGQP